MFLCLFCLYFVYRVVGRGRVGVDWGLVVEGGRQTFPILNHRSTDQPTNQPKKNTQTGRTCIMSWSSPGKCG